MKRTSRTPLRLGAAIFLALLFPSSAFATTDGASVSNSSNHELSMESTGDGEVTMSFVSGSIRDTGRGSNNEVDIDVEEDTTVTNTNDVVVENENDQTAVTGNAVVRDNRNGGNATSGDARNENTTDICVDIDNSLDGSNRGADACDEEEVVVTPPPQVGGQGGGEVLGTTTTTTSALPVGGSGAGVAPTAVLPAALPATGSSNDLGMLLAILASSLTYTVMLRRQKILQMTAGAQ